LTAYGMDNLDLSLLNVPPESCRLCREIAANTRKAKIIEKKVLGTEAESANLGNLEVKWYPESQVLECPQDG